MFVRDQRVFLYSENVLVRQRSCFCRLLLPYERYQRGEEEKEKLNNERRIKTTSLSEDSDVKEESNDLCPSETPPPVEAISAITTSPQPITSAATTVNVVSTKIYVYYIFHYYLM